MLREGSVPEERKKAWEMIYGPNWTERDEYLYALGECYNFEYGVERNTAKAIDFYRRATNTETRDLGARYSHSALVCLYEEGDVVDCCMEKAIHHFSFAADLIHTEAQ